MRACVRACVCVCAVTMHGENDDGSGENCDDDDGNSKC